MMGRRTLNIAGMSALTIRFAMKTLITPRSRISLAMVARVCARSFVAAVLLAGLASCTRKPSVAPVAAAAPVAPTLSSADSRFVFLPPIDDGGKSSGSHAVTICLPAGYESTDRRYPVFYILDGDNAFLTRQHGIYDAIGYELVHDQLVHEGLIQPAIFVAIHNSLDSKGNPVPRNRYTDYCATGQTDKKGVVGITKAEGYYDFLAHTIKPMIDRTYRTRPEPASTGVTGFSAGGAGAFWITYLHPETFGMGICQSPPFWAPYYGRELKGFVENPKRPIPAVRLWLDAGSREYDFIYKDAYATYRTLIARGFRPNENLAFYTGHDHGHEKFDCNRRMRSALYFMLRTKTPQLTGVEITDVDAVAGGTISLARRGHAVLETVYDNWFRLTDCTAKFAVADPAVVSFDETLNELRPQAAGKTTISSSFAGRQIVQQVEVPASELPLACKATKRPVVVDGDLSDWSDLPCRVDAPQSDGDAPAWTGPSDLSYRFACTHDDQFLYIAIQTTDDHLNSEPDKDPWFQDGIEVRLDARPAAERLLGRGDNEGSDILLVAMSPARPGETRLPYDSAKLPPGTKAVCKATPAGHNTEIAIPFTYLDEKAGKPWTDVRINIVVNDLDNDYQGFRGDKIWWRPDWRDRSNIRGSGTFERQPAARQASQ